MNQQHKIRIFFCYAQKDQAILRELQKHLASLRRINGVSTWSDLDISPGVVWEKEISEQLSSAQIILLLVSADFLASDYCYSTEMTKALERHERGKAQVIPIIIRPCNWQRAPFSKLWALPKDALPITRWTDRDNAFLNVAQQIEHVVEAIAEKITINVSAEDSWTKNAQTNDEIVQSAPVKREKTMSFDPMILAALTAGATAIINSTASDGAKSAYDHLKMLISRHFAGNTEAEKTLAHFEQKPHIWQEPLREELSATNIEQDPEIISTASQLLQLVQQTLDQPQHTRFINHINSVGHMVQGDHNTMHVTNYQKPEPNP